MTASAAPVFIARLAPVPAEVAEAVARLEAACAGWPRQDVPQGAVGSSGAAAFACEIVAPGADAALSVLFWVVLAIGAVAGVVSWFAGLGLVRGSRALLRRFLRANATPP